MIKSEKGLVTLEWPKPVVLVEMACLMHTIESNEHFRNLWKEAKEVKRLIDKIDGFQAEEFDFSKDMKHEDPKKPEDLRHAKKDASDKSIDDLLIEMLLKGLK